MTYDDILALAQQLPAADKARLLQDISAALQQDLTTTTNRDERSSLYGLWEGVRLSEEDIDEARDEMWRNFPREDI